MVLITGGVRSGKTAFAHQLASQAGGCVCYIATGVAVDMEMRQRIERHRKERPAHWMTVEAPLELLPAIEEQTGTLLLDCLGGWVSNLMVQACSDWDAADTQQAQALEVVMTQRAEQWIAAMAQREGLCIIVSNEVGEGVIPATFMGRTFRDMLGRLNILCAQHADTVYHMRCGIPQCIKGRDAL